MLVFTYTRAQMRAEMVNFICQFFWVTRYQIFNQTLFWKFLWQCFSDETNIHIGRLWVKQIILHNVSNLLKASIQHRLTSFEQEEILPVSDLWTWTTVLSLGLQSTSLTCRFWIYHGSTTVRWFLKINLSLYTHTHTHTHTSVYILSSVSLDNSNSSKH